MKTKIEQLYLIYVNDFLSVENFANYIDVSINKANRIIDLGRRIHHWNYTKRLLKIVD